MRMERLQLPPVGSVPETIRRTALWGALAALVDSLRRWIESLRSSLPEPDSEIAWEDGEVEEEGESRL